MPSKKITGLTLALGLALMLAATLATAQTETILYDFKANGIDGTTPYGGLTWDAAGNLYGITFNGGRYQGGIVFELSPTTGGGWSETILHTFPSGQNPSGRVAIDAAGNVYGATTNGGSYNKGIVYELIPSTGGGRGYVRLHAFGNSASSDGAYPMGGLTIDAAGNLYGATGAGGAFDGGTIFEMKHTTGGWTKTLLTQFNPSVPGPGYDPNGDLALDASGALYGTTLRGGSNPGFAGVGCGTIFKLTPSSNGWTRTTIHEFGSGTDGVEPYAGVILDGAGNLYGTTLIGGLHNEGIAYQLTHTGTGWVQKVLHNFADGAYDGYNPITVLLLDSAGDVYGATSNGGDNQQGTIFKLTSAATGAWPETIIHRFNYSTFTDGFYPDSPLIFDATGNLYGMTTKGGTNDVGAVFKITF